MIEAGGPRDHARACAPHLLVAVAVDPPRSQERRGTPQAAEQRSWDGRPRLPVLDGVAGMRMQHLRGRPRDSPGRKIGLDECARDGLAPMPDRHRGADARPALRRRQIGALPGRDWTLRQRSAAVCRGSCAAPRPDPTVAIPARRSSHCRAGTCHSRDSRSPWPAGTRASRESRARRRVEDAAVRLRVRNWRAASSNRCRSPHSTASGLACSPARRVGGSRRTR